MGGGARSRPRRHLTASNRDACFSYSISSGRTTQRSALPVAKIGFPRHIRQAKPFGLVRE
jgi:hypothetical protein